MKSIYRHLDIWLVAVADVVLVSILPLVGTMIFVLEITQYSGILGWFLHLWYLPFEYALWSLGDMFHPLLFVIPVVTMGLIILAAVLMTRGQDIGRILFFLTVAGANLLEVFGVWLIRLTFISSHPDNVLPLTRTLVAVVLVALHGLYLWWQRNRQINTARLAVSTVS